MVQYGQWNGKTVVLEKILDLNCANNDSFTLEFGEENVYGITTDQDLVRRWLRDLRAGKYKQLQGKMFEANSDTSYCALGVLYKKRIRRLKQKANTENDALTEIVILDDIVEHDDTYLDHIYVYTPDGFKFNLYDFIMELNDQCKLAFGVIADIVELIHCEIRGEDTKKLTNSLLKQNKWTFVYEQ